MNKKDFKDLVEKYGWDFVNDEGFDYAPQYMSELYYYAQNPKSFQEFMESVFYGEDYSHGDKFIPWQEYFFLDDLGHLNSLGEEDLTDYLVDLIIDAGEEDTFMEWLADNGYSN